MKSKAKLNCTNKYIEKAVVVLTGVVLAAGVMWIVIWLLTGSWELNFNRNAAGFVNGVLKSKSHALSQPVVYQLFEDDGKISVIFILGVFLIFVVLSMIFSALLYKRRVLLKGLWSWAACMALVLIIACITGAESSIKEAVSGWHEAFTSNIEDWRYLEADDPMTLGDFSELDGLDLKETPALEVIMSQPQCYYLRGYVGEIYEADGWRRLNGDELAEENELFLQLYKLGFRSHTILANAISLTNYYKGSSLDATDGTDSANHAAGDDGGDDDSVDIITNKITVINRETDSRYTYIPYEMLSINIDTKNLIGDSAVIASDIKDNKNYTLTAAEFSCDKNSQIKILLGRLQEQSQAEDFFQEEYSYRQFVDRKYLQITQEARQALKDFLEDKGYDDDRESDNGGENIGDERSSISAAEVKTRILNSLEDFKYEKNATYRAEQGDFLTNFFNEKEGYSVHFATAAVMIFRYYNIPARFAEGYLIMPEDADEAQPDEAINIDKTHYHAWAEYYEEGVGWVPFEATPAYIGIMPADISVTYQQEDSTSVQTLQQENEKTNEVNNLITEEAEINLWSAAKILLLIMLVCALAALAIWRLTHRKFDGFRKKDFKSQDCRLAIMAMMAYMRKLTGKGAMMIPNEAQKLYEEARYSDHLMTQKQKEAMAEYVEKVKSLKKNNKISLGRNKRKEENGVEENRLDGR